MKKEKLEQLKKVFGKIIFNAIKTSSKGKSYFGNRDFIEEAVNELLYEVKIRINNK